MRLVKTIASVLLLLLVGAVLAGGGGGGGSSGGSGGSDDDGGGSGAPSDSEYERSLESGSYADVEYQVWRCADPSPGTYTRANARASTSTSIKSRYLAHNVRLKMNGNQLDKTDDLVRSVSGASETNFITSIPSVEASRELSCPQALFATFEANSWHKGVSIYENRHSFYKYDLFRG